MKSIMQNNQDYCYLCEKVGPVKMIWGGLETHHVFGGTANRRLSELYGLKVRVCIGHHREGPYAAHNNAEIDRILKQDAQRAFEKKHSHEDFMRTFGRNYLDDPEEEIWDPLEAGMEAAAECARSRERAAGLPPGIQMLSGEELECRGDPYIRIRKVDAAYGLSQSQFRNLTEIVETLKQRDTAERL